MKNSHHSICPKCHAEIPEDAPEGLCPSCALESAATTSNRAIGGGITPSPGVENIAPHFPDLEILELIGVGGMGAVYKARQPQLDRMVALKILSHDLAGDPAFVERFNREARVLARLSHPNIVGIHDFGTAGPYCYLTMELVDGVNLRQAMQAGRFTPTEALAMVQHLCAALKFAHEEGILHRDIKPENILIDSKGRVKIADFGIAKLVGEDRQHDVTLTLQGSVLGSPHYMAPEQIETPGEVDQRADIYSLGVVLYEMLTGGLPIGRFALPSEKAAMDARIDQIVMRTLEKEREARYQSAGEVGTEVEALGKSPAPIPSGSTPAVVGSGMERFSLLSAILTGLSLVLAAVLVVINISVNASRMPGQAPYIITGTPMFLFGLPAAITGIIGFILGVRALGEIRRSGGTKTGLGRAIFATTAWPIALMFFALVSISVAGNPVKWAWAVSLSLLATLPSGLLLIRSLCRWGCGFAQRDGTRIFPGFGRTILPVAICLLVGSLLSVAAWNYLPSALRVGPPPGSPAASVDWVYGTPELSLGVRLNSDDSCAYRLVWQDAEGNVTREPIGVLSGKDSVWGKGKSPMSVVRIGLARGEGEGNRGFVGTLDATGERSRIVQVTDPESWDLKVDITYPEGHFFFGAAPNTKTITMATLRDADGEILETLQLEVVSTKR